MSNLFAAFRRLIPQPALQVGTMTSLADGVATVTLPGGATIQARGGEGLQLPTQVFVRDSVIEGQAPGLPVEVITV